MPNRIPLDPKLPKAFDATPNEDRSKSQLDLWWDRPYGITRSFIPDAGGCGRLFAFPFP